VANSNRASDFLWYGQLLARAKKNTEAQKAFHRAVELDPKVPEGWLALVALLVEDGKTEEAQRVVLDAQVKLSEDRTPLVLAQCYQIMGDTVRAEQQFLNAASLYPSDLAVLRRVARFYLQSKQGDKARKFLDEMLRIASRDPEQHRKELVWTRRSLARVLASSGQYRQQQQALKLLEDNVRGKRASIEDMRLQATILATHSDRRSRLKAIKIFERVMEKHKEALTPDERFVLAQLYDSTDRWSLCREQMLDLLAAHPKNIGFLTAFNQMLLRHDSPVAAITPWINKLEKLQPESPVTVSFKARLLVRSGKLDEAVSLLESLIPRPLPPSQIGRLREVAAVLEDLEQYLEAKKLLVEFAGKTPGGSLPLAAFLGRRGKVNEALKQCEAALQEAPIGVVIATGIDVLRKNRSKINGQHFRLVEKWFNRAKKEESNSKDIQLQFAAFRDLEGRNTELIAIYREFLARDDVSEREKALVSNNLAFLLAILNSDGEEALRIVNNAIGILGPSPELLDTRAVAFLAQGQNKAAIADLRRAIADNPSAVKYFHLALAHKAANDQRSAIRAIQIARDNHQLTAETVPPIERERYEKLIVSLGLM